MASYTRKEVTTVRVIFEIPCYLDYAVHAEVMRAIEEARAELKPLYPYSIPDDAVKVSPADDKILVWYEKEGSQ